jgi:hypothetical protein
LTVSVEASDSAFSNPNLIDEAGQQVTMILFFLDINPYSMLQEVEWIQAANWLMMEDELDGNGMGNWTVEWSDVNEILGNHSGTWKDRHIIYAMAMDQDGYPGVLSAVEFLFECSNCTVTPSSMPSMRPSLQPSMNLFETSSEDNSDAGEPKVTIAEIADHSSTAVGNSPLGSGKMISVGSCVILIGLLTFV